MMKRTTILLALFVVSLHGMAQKFLDIYTDNQVVSSVSTADVDSMTVNGTGSDRTVNFWKDDKIVHHAATAAIDSIKVYRPQDDPLVYLGIVGFNQELYEKPIGVLGTNTAGSYKSFVSGLSRKDGTLLYYAVDDGLDMLTSYNFETPLNNIYLITFTDGLDQGSLMMNGNYTSSNDYLTAVSNRIGNTRIKGLPLTAYSIGLRGSDVTDYAMFQNNLKRLASSDDKAFEVNSLTDVNSRLQEIAATINSSITTKTYTNHADHQFEDSWHRQRFTHLFYLRWKNANQQFDLHRGHVQPSKPFVNQCGLPWHQRCHHGEYCSRHAKRHLRHLYVQLCQGSEHKWRSNNPHQQCQRIL